MQTILMNNRIYVALPIIAEQLKVSRQRVYQLIKERNIDKISIGKRSFAISFEHFEKLKNAPRISGKHLPK